MKPQQRNFIVEVKSGRRRSAVRPASIWGDTDLKALVGSAASLRSCRSNRRACAAAERRRLRSNRGHSQWNSTGRRTCSRGRRGCCPAGSLRRGFGLARKRDTSDKGAAGSEASSSNALRAHPTKQEGGDCRSSRGGRARCARGKPQTERVSGSAGSTGECSASKDA